ncbi:MAG: serine/threonine-protein kinase, partial [Planctomycetota bacterium]
IQVAALLSHPSIVTVLHRGKDQEGNDFFTMPMITGVDLQQCIAEGHVPREQLIQHFVKACDALAYAHQAGVIHRDIKPHNIMVGEFGETQVVDWGMAKLIKPDASPVSPDIREIQQRVDPSHRIGDHIDDLELTYGARPGTLHYMSPEQLVCDESGESEPSLSGEWSDIYGLGATLFQILTGRAPFAGVAKDQIINRILEARFPRPRDLDRTIDRALEAIVLKAMHREASQRYQSVSALRDDVQHWLSGRPVSAFPESFLRRSRRWIIDHQTLSVFIAATLIVAVVVLGLERKNLHDKNDRLLRLAASQQESSELHHLADDRVQAMERAIAAEANRKRLFLLSATPKNHLAWVRSLGHLALMTHKSRLREMPGITERIQQLYQSTFEELDRFESTHGESVESEWLRIRTLGNRGMSDVMLSSPEAAIKTYQEAISRLRRLMNSNSPLDRSAMTMELARLEGNLGDAHFIAFVRLDCPETSGNHHLELEIAARKRSVNAALDLPDPMLEASVARVQIARLGRSLLLLDREQEAVTSLRKVLARTDSVDRVELSNATQSVCLVHCFAALARHEEDPDRASAFEGRAIQAFKQAIVSFKGSTGTPPELVFESVPGIESLSDRVDFQELCDEVQRLSAPVP